MNKFLLIAAALAAAAAMTGTADAKNAQRCRLAYGIEPLSCQQSEHGSTHGTSKQEHTGEIKVRETRPAKTSEDNAS